MYANKESKGIHNNSHMCNGFLMQNVSYKSKSKRNRKIQISKRDKFNIIMNLFSSRNYI